MTCDQLNTNINSEARGWLVDRADDTMLIMGLDLFSWHCSLECFLFYIFIITEKARVKGGERYKLFSRQHLNISDIIFKRFIFQPQFFNDQQNFPSPYFLTEYSTSSRTRNRWNVNNGKKIDLPTLELHCIIKTDMRSSIDRLEREWNPRRRMYSS
jgi:hypothetical protein